MKTYLPLLLFFVLVISCKDSIEKDKIALTTVFENSKGTETATYQETIDFYLLLAREFPEINVQTIGQTDSGYPLHLVTYNPDGNFNFQKIGQEKTIILVNNGIHPGEPDGIDATMLLFRDLSQDSLPTPENVVIATIPVYNVGGMLNRNSTSRANQNGPEAYGFRGNAQNYDLNRDFIKMDTQNAKTFSSIFHLVKPDIFIDNHVSNGADYQYTLTHLFTQHNKLGGELGTYLHKELMPSLEAGLSASNWDITPYVNVFNRTPETGFSQFLDNPRYSTGYTTLWNTLGLMVETHMLKPYKKRVEGTYQLMANMIEIADKDHKKIKKLRADTAENQLELKMYHTNWKVDTTRTSTLHFKGFKADTLISQVTGKPRLKYQKDQPFELPIAYQNHFVPKDTIEIPAAYIVKKGWRKVVERLSANKINFFELAYDTVITAEKYRIKGYETFTNPYEGHYPHYNTQVAKSMGTVRLDKGDYIVPTNQVGMRYLLETLEPIAPDSFFNWNFFDVVLQQKEHFSPYVFEDIASALLEENTTLRDSFELKKRQEPVFAENWYAQLNWIYKNSPHYEAAHLQYPVYRIPKNSEASFLLEN